jgi:hypothetical protein
MRSFYMLTFTTLLLISLGLLAVAATFSGVLVIPPTMADTASDFDEDASNTISGFDGMRGSDAHDAVAAAGAGGCCTSDEGRDRRERPGRYSTSRTTLRTYLVEFFATLDAVISLS